MNDQNQNEFQSAIPDNSGISGADLQRVLQEDQREIEANTVPAVIGGEPEGIDPYSPIKIVEGLGRAVDNSKHIGGELLDGLGIENPMEGHES